MPDNNIQTELERFVLDNADLERLEDLLSEINIFEAIAQVRAEEVHSQFLAFLLDPQQAHGLGDIFLKRVLQRALVGANDKQGPISAIDVDVWDLDDMLVGRERFSIDVLLISETHKLAVIIENKTFSFEHTNQLQRYYQTVQQEFPGYKIIGLFLTIAGDEPSDCRYIPVTYETVCDILEQIVDRRRASLGSDVLVVLRHYVRMVRRYFMEETELVELAKQIYRKHRIALDFIFEQRPDLQTAIATLAHRLIDAKPELAKEHSIKSAVRFVPNQFDKVAILKPSSEATSIKRILFFEFRIRLQDIRLALVIGPGNQAVRQKVFEVSAERRDLFTGTAETLYPEWTTIWQRKLLQKRDLETGDWDKISKKIEKGWESFLEIELSVLTNEICTKINSVTPI